MEVEFDFGQKKIESFPELFEMLEDNSLKYHLLKKAVEQYKYLRDKKNDLRLSNESITKTIEDLKIKTSSVKDLIKIKDRVDFELVKFRKIEKSDKELKKLKDKRISKINNLLIYLRNLTSGMSNKENDLMFFEGDYNVKAKSILFLSFITFIFGIIFYLFSFKIIILIVALIVTIINIMSFFLINLFQDTKLLEKDLGLFNYNDSSNNYYQQFVKKLSERENAFFVNASWKLALERERKQVLSSIESRLGGRSFDDIDEQIKVQNNLMLKQENEINNILDSVISAESYLKIRRELDLVSLEGVDDQIGSKEINFIVRGIDNLGSKLKSYVMNYLTYLKNHEIIKELSYL